MDFATARCSMVQSQLLPNRVTDERVVAAMSAEPRELFVPEALQAVAYVDEDVPLGNGRCLMAPMVLARLLQAAGVGPTDMVLDVGCATGYSSAVLAHLSATVFALEEDPALSARAAQLIARRELGNIALVSGPLAAGCADHAPYDVIVVNGAIEQVPEALVAQLNDGGRLVAVLGDARLGRASLLVKSNGVCGTQPLFDAAVPPLPAFARPRGFVF